MMCHMKAMVTDTSTLIALGIMRCLGKRGIKVYALGTSRTHGLDLCFHSRYCEEGIIGPDPQADGYIEFLIEILKSRSIDVFIPVGYLSTAKAAENRESLDLLTRLEIADAESIRLAQNKRRTYELAENLRIPYPRTIYPRNFDDVKEISGNIRYPAVIKPICENEKPLYPRTSKEFCQRYREMCQRHHLSEDSLPMVQEYIKTDFIHSFSALYQNGTCKRVFMWKEMRSVPPSGGTSSYSQSIYDPTVKEYGIRLLDRLHWNGVANIEFKLDRSDGDFKLMEINPRFWGSVDVALNSGVEFPYLLCKMAIGEQLDYSEEYERNVKFHWLSREIQHGLQCPRSIPKIASDTFDREVRSNFEVNDLLPHMLEFAFLARERVRTRANL